MQLLSSIYLNTISCSVPSPGVPHHLLIIFHDVGVKVARMVLWVLSSAFILSPSNSFGTRSNSIHFGYFCPYLSSFMGLFSLLLFLLYLSSFMGLFFFFFLYFILLCWLRHLAPSCRLTLVGWGEGVCEDIHMFLLSLGNFWEIGCGELLIWAFPST